MINDKYSTIPSKEERFRRRMIEEKKCVACSKPNSDPSREECPSCREKRAERRKKNYIPKLHKPHPKTGSKYDKFITQ